MANRGWARVTCCWSVGSVLRHCRKPGSQLYLLCLRPPRKKDIAFHSLPDHRRCEVKKCALFLASRKRLRLLSCRTSRPAPPLPFYNPQSRATSFAPLRHCATNFSLGHRVHWRENGNNAECDEKGQKTTMNGKSDKYHKKFRKRVSI